MTDSFTAYASETVTVDGLESDDWFIQFETVGKVSGRSREGDTNTRTVSVGGVERPVVEGGLHIPLAAPVPEPGFELVCTAVGANSDPSLLNRRWRVVDVPAKSYATARRLDVVEVPAEEAP
jgi:hypothetical protein